MAYVRRTVVLEEEIIRNLDEAHRRDRLEVEHRYKQIRGRLQLALKDCASLNKLVEYMPEVWRYVPPRYLDALCKPSPSNPQPKEKTHGICS